MQTTTEPLTKGDIAHIQRTAQTVPPIQRTVRRTLYGAELMAMGYDSVHGEPIEADRYYAVDTIREENVVALLTNHCREHGMVALPALAAELRNVGCKRGVSQHFVKL